MNKELQSYYEERFSMMATKGWKDLMEDVDKMLEVVSNIDNSNTGDQLHFRKGQKDIITWLTTLKETSERAYEELKNEGTV